MLGLKIRGEGAAPTGRALPQGRRSLWEARPRAEGQALHTLTSAKLTPDQITTLVGDVSFLGAPPMRFSSHRLRQGRVSETGRAYLITTTTLQRRPVFADWAAARLLVSALRHEAGCGASTTLAYVAMPDHLHWLMQLGQGATLATVVGRVKGVVAHALGEPVWQAGFHDHAVRADEDLARIAHYLVMNPVRAGLVRRVGDYPHWDAIWL